MKIRDIETFFEEVDNRLQFPIRVILTGGAAGIIYGTDRATYDIDFEVNFLKKNVASEKWERLQRVLEEVAVQTKITPQYADDIDRWSSIALPLKKSQLFKKIGKVEIRIMEPAYWAVGKLTRFLSSDADDLVSVLKKQKANPRECARVWGQALRISPPSPAQFTFRKQVENFFDTYSKTIWGSAVDAAELKELFSEEAKKK